MTSAVGFSAGNGALAAVAAPQTPRRYRPLPVARVAVIAVAEDRVYEVLAV